MRLNDQLVHVRIAVPDHATGWCGDADVRTTAIVTEDMHPRDVLALELASVLRAIQVPQLGLLLAQLVRHLARPHRATGSFDEERDKAHSEFIAAAEAVIKAEGID